MKLFAILLILVLALGLPGSTALAQQQVFHDAVSTQTLFVSYTESNSDSACSGADPYVYARAHLDCNAALSGHVVSRSFISDCWASAQGTMTVTAYANPATGEPLAPGNGGVPITSFPAGSRLYANVNGAMFVVEVSVGDPASGEAYAEINVGPESVSVESLVGDPGSIASLDSLDVMDGSAIPVSIYVSHTNSQRKLAIAALKCGLPNGYAHFVLVTPSPLEMPVPVEKTTWSAIKSQY